MIAAAVRGPRVSVEIVRGLDQLLAALTVRAVVYIGEQDYAIGDEFDGGDLCGATHFLARLGDEPVGACRARWYAGFVKLERMAVKRGARSGGVSRALFRAAADLARYKGYRCILGHIEGSLLAYWAEVGGFRRREDRPSYKLDGREFFEAIAELEPHPNALCLDTPPNVVLASDADAPTPIAQAASR
jgi:GNAT superfamily N-acetyltransferase